MKIQMPDQVIGVPMTPSTYRIERTSRCYLLDAASQYRIPSSAEGSNTFRKSKGNFVLKRMNKLGKKADTFAHGVREHVKLGPKITETVKGKLSLGARILQVGGVDKIFKQLFCVGEGEKLLKACQCYLSTTAGPIAGLLFISSQKVAFCSDRSIKISSPNGESLRVHYKVLIPLEKIKGVNESENMKKPSQKYMEIVTVDGFDFWFMGFLNYQKAFKYLQQTISQRLLHDIGGDLASTITSVGNGDISAPQGPITGKSNGAAAGGSSGKSAKQPPQYPAEPAGSWCWHVWCSNYRAKDRKPPYLCSGPATYQTLYAYSHRHTKERRRLASADIRLLDFPI